MAVVKELTKQPGETRLFGMDFSNKMSSSETISSIDSAVVDPVGEMTAASNTISGKVANVLVAAGEDGKTYKVTVTVTTDLGQILENEGYVSIAEV